MLVHFQWQPLFSSQTLPGWKFSFFFKGIQYKGIYHKDGSVEWTSQQPPEQEKIISQIHELMLFHVYS
ncbi:YheE family protein [Microbacteriaceae bacterium 4G12]